MMTQHLARLQQRLIHRVPVHVCGRFVSFWFFHLLPVPVQTSVGRFGVVQVQGCGGVILCRRGVSNPNARFASRAIQYWIHDNMQSIASRSTVSPTARVSRGTNATKSRPQKRTVVAAASSHRDDADNSKVMTWLAGRRLQQAAVGVAAGAVLAVAPPAMARLEGVNNPQMLPPGDVQEVLDVAGE